MGTATIYFYLFLKKMVAVPILFDKIKFYGIMIDMRVTVIRISLLKRE